MELFSLILLILLFASTLSFANKYLEERHLEKQLYHDKIVSIDGNTITVEYKEIK